MKINIEAEVSEFNYGEMVDLETDLGIPKEEWDSLNEEQREEILQEYLNEQHNQPYWVFTKYEEL